MYCVAFSCPKILAHVYSAIEEVSKTISSSSFKSLFCPLEFESRILTSQLLRGGPLIITSIIFKTLLTSDPLTNTQAAYLVT